MFNGIPVLETISEKFYITVLVILAVFFFLTLIRMVKGPGVADRLLAANVMGGLAIVAIVLLGMVLEESYLLDIAMVYALISFLAVVVLAQIYIGVFRDRNAEDSGEEDK